MAEPAGPDGDPAALVAGYEGLRAAVLAGRPEGWRLGHGLLADRGMAAWIATCSTLPLAQATGTPVPDVASAGAAPFPSTARPPARALSSLPAAGAIVAVLAQMALAHA